MSLGARATKGGAKAATKDGKPQDKGKTDKPQPKEKIKPQATTEQIRMANMIDRKSDDSFDVRRMVLDLMEMTCRTEDEVCSALHDADNDMQAACNLLLEESQRIQGEWQTSEKKKKKPPAAVSNGEQEPPRDPRSRSGPRPPRRGEGEAAVRGRGGARGRGGGRGMRGRGGRRSAPGRGRGPSRPQQGWPNSPDDGNNLGDGFPTTEDWDNEEWSGSLSDTKVFTPSVQNSGAEPEAISSQPSNSVEDWDSPQTNNGHIPTYTYHNNQMTQPHIEQISPAPSSLPPTNSAPILPKCDTYQPVPRQQQQQQQQHQQAISMTGSLNAAESQYLSQLMQQTNRHDTSVYTTNYGVYGATDLNSQRKPQRARVPPPSKIPATAVEMPGGVEALLDVQFGAVEDEPAPPDNTKQVTSQVETQPVTSHEPVPEPASYPNPASMLNDSLSVVESTPSSQSIVTEPVVTNNTASLDKQLASTMKQLAGSAEGPPATQPTPSTHHLHTQHRGAKPTVGQQNVYAPHHTVSHHPQVYNANMYAQQVNSTSASLTGASTLTATYPSLDQYQPVINSYQVQQTSSSAGVYGGNALYTAAPYSAYTTPTPQAKPQPKETQQVTQQYESPVASSNSLTNTSTTPTSTAKVTATTAVSSNTTGYGMQTAAAAAAALYSQQGAPYAAYDETQLVRGVPHHMSGYYEVGYGVGGARDATFGLGAGERFGRADAASPQQVPAALPPGYAYFYQPPPTTYQYGVYPTYGGGSNVGGVGGVTAGGKLSTYSQQQPPYEAQDTYKQGGPYNANANKSASTGAAGDLSNAMYTKAHVALNKLNNYEKAAFHSGTPPPFGAGSHHLYIPGPPPHHHHHHLQPHQMDVRVNSSHRRESGAGGATNAAATRGAAGKPAASKPPAYGHSYWPTN